MTIIGIEMSPSGRTNGKKREDGKGRTSKHAEGTCFREALRDCSAGKKTGSATRAHNYETVVFNEGPLRLKRCGGPKSRIPGTGRQLWRLLLH